MTGTRGAEADIAGVIAPPPLIYFGFLVAGFALDQLWPAAILGRDISPAVRIAIGAVPVGVGIAFGIAGFLQFRRAGTEVRPDRPTSALITSGLYRHSRNPLYLSMTLIYLGIAVLADNWWALILVVPTLALIRYGVIAREEAYLARKFGDAYRDYTGRVRRWI